MGPELLEKFTSYPIYDWILVRHLWVIMVVIVTVWMIIPAITKVVGTEKWKNAMYKEFEESGRAKRPSRLSPPIPASAGDESSDSGQPSAGPWHARHYRGRRPRVRDAFSATLPVIIGSALWISSVYFPFRQSGIFLEHTRTIIWLGVMLFSKLITHLHVAHVCGDPYYQWRRTYLIPLALITLNALWADTFSTTGEPLLDGLSVIIFCAVASTLSWAHMCYSVISGMCRVLGVPFLRVPERCNRPEPILEAKKSL